MKRLLYALLATGFLSFGFINHPDPVRLTNPIAKPAGTFTFERKGKTYTAKEVDGNIIMPQNKKNIYFVLSADVKEGGKDINLAIHFRNQDDLSAGKTYTLSYNPKDNDDKKPRLIIYSENDENDETKAISTGSESGSLTFSAINVAGQKATVSGKFEFKGKNNNDDPNAEKEITIKGSFSNLEIMYVSSAMFKQ